MSINDIDGPMSQRSFQDPNLYDRLAQNKEISHALVEDQMQRKIEQEK